MSPRGEIATPVPPIRPVAGGSVNCGWNGAWWGKVTNNSKFAEERFPFLGSDRAEAPPADRVSFSGRQHQTHAVDLLENEIEEGADARHVPQLRVGEQIDRRIQSG